MAKCFIAMLCALALLLGGMACAESADVMAYNGKRIGVATGSVFDAIVKEIPHNARGSLTAEFQPSAVCKTLDYATR